MIGKHKKDAQGATDGRDERLERFGRTLVRASAAAGEAEAERVAASPFLYARLRTRIRAEEERRAGGGETWRTLLGVVWRSVPAMALVAVFAFVLFWTSSLGTQTVSPGVLSDEALMDARDVGVESVVFAERRPLSSDDVLATILQEDDREANR
ncbi:MAG TPA: hypothetical protein VGW12_10185 [Pyrinomonadaceae bacterium]|nr:hypothetical protein [Pyrinomonadaceae bacterium]